MAKEYPSWQHVALVTLKKLYDENNQQFPDNKQIMNVLKNDESVKKHMKKLMPFVQHVKVIHDLPKTVYARCSQRKFELIAMKYHCSSFILSKWTLQLSNELANLDATIYIYRL